VQNKQIGFIEAFSMNVGGIALLFGGSVWRKLGEEL